MISFPAILFPILAAIVAIVLGRLGTVILDLFRKDELSVNMNADAVESSHAVEDKAQA